MASGLAACIQQHSCGNIGVLYIQPRHRKFAWQHLTGLHRVTSRHSWRNSAGHHQFDSVDIRHMAFKKTPVDK